MRTGTPYMNELIHDPMPHLLLVRLCPLLYGCYDAGLSARLEHDERRWSRECSRSHRAE